MNTLAIEAKATNISFDSSNMWVELADGRKLGVPLAYFPRLLHATARQRKNYTISGGGIGLHWEGIDEDISVRGLVMGVGDRTKPRERRRAASKKLHHSGRW
ncbi:MAG: DUF2442 domain-containing protein [Sedimentisphaerales bacterium]|jgi:hypothetical protein